MLMEAGINQIEIIMLYCKIYIRYFICLSLFGIYFI